MPPLRVHLLDPNMSLPVQARPGDAGFDLAARINISLSPGERSLVPTGVAMAIPEGYAAFVHPRSGLAARHGVSIVNAPGTIDSGYRGEVLVNLINLGQEPISFVRGDRIAQVVIQGVETPVFMQVDSSEELGESERGTGGHGHTGA